MISLLCHQRLLSSCKDLTFLLQIHARIITSGFSFNISTTTHLINLYSSFEKCNFSRTLFDSTPNPPVILWNSMIRAYIRTNRHQEALKMYSLMLEEKGIHPDKYTFTFVLKACTLMSDFEKGIKIHEEIVNRSLENDVFIGTGIIDMYSKMGDLESARKVFDKMPDKDVVVWNAMLSGVAQSEEPVKAVDLFKKMQFICQINPSSVTLLNLLPAVCKLMDMRVCRCIHGYVYRRVFPVSVYNALIDTYSKCNYSNVARQVFNTLRGKDDVSWGTMMAGYAYNGNFYEVLELFDCMKRIGLKMSKVAAVSALLGAGEMSDLERGIKIHEWSIQEMIDSDVMIATSLMTMYAKCGVLDKARDLFWGIGERDLVAWSAAIAAFSQSGYPQEAISLFRDMQNEYSQPNNVTLVSVIPACAELREVRLGKSVHCHAIKASMDSDISMGTALVSMYAKCNLFTSALHIFNKMPLTEVVTWNALINGYAQIGDCYNALEMFCQLRLSGLYPDPGTMVGVLPACASLGDVRLGTCLHCQIIRYGFESDCHVKNALIDLYAKCGNLSLAEFMFNKTEFSKDEVSWNTMIAGYMHNGLAKEALSAFHSMKFESFQPNVVTLVSILPAVSHLTYLREGMTIHAYIIKSGFQAHKLVGNSLIDMYAKCGQLDLSERIFEEMKNIDSVSWNALLTAYSMHGEGDRALSVFSLMEERDIVVDSISFLSVLSACRHSGLVEEGRKIFHCMRDKYHIEPDVEHYACLVDMLGRAGLFNEIMDLLNTMPMEPDGGVWGALLDASRMHSNIEIAEVALKHLVKIERGNPAHYVVLSSLYSQSGRWNDAVHTRVKMNEIGLRKNPGCSWVEVK
ncbi:pentatricopeptide repeat-containing protein At2g39620 [Solanum lycopersicum]|uniref:Pentacotripeptide-repeat region of PRORP domain-containing protein n=1 Tax=Solanum lycopersicum TaxID=4081 RepID=A0A3Q7G192_SOLLC|nr:pentatricopeptide repeat-containing protein At2g39620 [Solanum lycopersicum]XP_010319153.1 pentatricopeptide repeat-containing protein At2g39620 [Solanum lycopersicum]XP_010319154.1 pentatricopeptide repeat-containing protein At2g39620 [Solanum lycopersicum]